jgi:hypothetical protein
MNVIIPSGVILVSIWKDINILKKYIYVLPDNIDAIFLNFLLYSCPSRLTPTRKILE